MSALRKLRKKAADILFHEHWMIGWVDAPIAEALQWRTCPPVRWIGPRDKTRYLADPFAWPGKPGVVLCEEYDFATRLGRLRRLEVDGQDIRAEEAVDFGLPGHLSFPFLFAHEGEVYCLPESSAARRLALFRWQEGKGWQHYATPLESVAAADSVLFTHGGHFWIAYTDVGQGAMDNLHLRYATALTGPWTPHPGNPVAKGKGHARCGGTPFVVEGTLYRPAQDCTKTYGGALRIMRVLECTPETYREEEAAHILPAAGRNPHGFHTLSACGERCLVDGKRLMFSPRRLAGKVMRRIARRCSRA